MGWILRAVALAGILLVPACAQSPWGTPEPHPEPRPAPLAGHAPAVQEAQPGPEPVEYRLGAGDIIRITVYDHPDLATEAEVGEDGRIAYPLIGEVRLLGLTRDEARRMIATQLRDGGFIPDAHVSVLVVDYRSRHVSVVGEVAKPGVYPVRRAVPVTEMLAQAGGINADGSHVVTIISRGADGTTARRELDVRGLMRAGARGDGVLVYHGDTVFVPPAPVFYITGEVRKPGAYPLAPDMTVRQALAVGGGLTVRGTERGIRLDRRAENGDVHTRRADPTDRLRPNDVVRVPERWF
jgi:polysaccharide biosynthesis/export protein